VSEALTNKNWCYWIILFNYPRLIDEIVRPVIHGQVQIFAELRRIYGDSRGCEDNGFDLWSSSRGREERPGESFYGGDYIVVSRREGRVGSEVDHAMDVCR
jgi:hypothetical protein